MAHLDCASEGAIRMQFLADSILLSRSGLTRLIDRMADTGLVTRKACPEDRRGTYVVITPDGRAAFRCAMPGHIRSIQAHFLRHMSEEDVRALRGALSKVLEAEPNNRKEILDNLSVTTRGGKRGRDAATGRPFPVDDIQTGGRRNDSHSRRCAKPLYRAALLSRTLVTVLQAAVSRV